MTFTAAFNFSIAMLLLASVPGPGVFATVAQALSSGFKSSLYVIAGIVLGDLVFLMVAVFGLSAISHLLGDLFFVVKILGGLYLIWLGYKTLRDRSFSLSNEEAPKRENLKVFLAGLAITLSNPKVIIFYCGFLPGFMDLGDLKMIDILSVSLIVMTVLSSVMMIYSYLASQGRRLFSDEKKLAALNVAAGSVISAVGLYLIFS